MGTLNRFFIVGLHQHAEAYSGQPGSVQGSKIEPWPRHELRKAGWLIDLRQRAESCVKWDMAKSGRKVSVYPIGHPLKCSVLE
jgi:hypothetical protein